VAVVAPSSPFDTIVFERGLSVLRARFDVVVAGVYDVEGFLAGTDDHRVECLERVLADPSIRAVIAARGGHGATRLLDRIPRSWIERDPKLLVGFSDVTALHALWARAGLRSLHAPMVTGLGRMQPERVARWADALGGAIPAPVRVTPLSRAPRQSTATGALLGGNLAVLTALVGTPFLPPLDACVLFLEDVGERPYRVDRMLTTLRHAGVLARIAGIVVGAFTECHPGPDRTSVEDVIVSHFGGLPIPVATGVPAGHIDDSLPLPFGATVVLDLSAGTLSFGGSAVEPSS
jgi:muramoyltetrapeptide carboxypeptidase